MADLETTDTTTPAGEARTARLVLLASTLGIFIALLDVNIVNVALPTIGRDLGGSLSDLEWVVNAYVLTLAVLIVTAGRLGDLFGRRTVYIAGLTLFTAGLAICALATDITLLHVGRVVQGAGGACILPLSLALLYSVFSRRRLASAIGLWGAAGGLATALGPLVGGLLVDHVSWQAIFLINIPIGAITVLVALAGVPDVREDPGAAARSLDLPGVVSIGASLLCLNLALVQGRDWGWGSGRVLGLFAVALVAAIAFLLIERRSRAPLVDLVLFRSRTFTGAVIAGFTMGAGMFAMFFFIAIYLQAGLGASPQGAGLRFLPLSAMLIVAARLSPKLSERFGVRATVSGSLVVMAGGLALLTMLDPGGDLGSWTRLLPGLIVCGIGLGVAFPVVSGLVVASAPPGKLGVASSLGTMFRQVGNAIGIAVLGAVVGHQALSTGGAVSREASRALGQGVQSVLWIAVGVSLAGALVAMLMVRPGEMPAPAGASPAPSPATASTG